jgi:hypothetical protein
MHMIQRELLEGSSDVVVESDVPTHTHANNITHTQHAGQVYNIYDILLWLNMFDYGGPWSIMDNNVWLCLTMVYFD